MNFTHIIMPRKCRVVSVKDAVNDPDFKKHHPSVDFSDGFDIRNPTWRIWFTEKEHGYLYPNCHADTYIKELPPNAQEFPFSVDRVDSIAGEYGIPYAGAIKGCGNSSTTTEGYNNIVTNPNPPTQLVEESLVGKWFYNPAFENFSLAFKVVSQEGEICKTSWWDEDKVVTE